MKKISVFLSLISQLWTSPPSGFRFLGKSGPRVAIIGSGIGGASTAYFLQEKYKGLQPLSIDVYDPGPVGGRLATVIMAGREYEVGGSVIHGQNQLMKDLMKAVNLEPNPDLNERFAIIGRKDEVLFNEWPYFGSLQMIYRYGPSSLIKLQFLISSMLKEFHKIYAFLDKGQTFNSPVEFLQIISPHSKKNKNQPHSFVNLTHISIQDLLTQMDFNPELIQEIASVAMRCNYGQSLKEIHAFVGLVSLAGSDGSLWSVKGGNKGIPKALLNISNVHMIKKKVSRVRPLAGDDEAYVIDTEDGYQQEQNIYDAVVIAAPLTLDMNKDLRLPEHPRIKGKYHLTVTTIIHGVRSPDFFPDVSSDFFLYSDEQSVLNSINLLKPVDYISGEKVPSVWKIFSQRTLTDTELNQIFSVIHSKRVIPWLAYPNYKETYIGQSVLSFPGYKHLYYLNSIEWAASAMEMSAINGKNIANMIYNEFSTCKAF